ncbi:MAG TPA: hypothetical protein VE269_06330, partial [Gaiellaceae bacterium]|nr:hypothetical protein [Gaiellaceae bacterium]
AGVRGKTVRRPVHAQRDLEVHDLARLPADDRRHRASPCPAARDADVPRERSAVPSYYLIPTLLTVMTVVLMALIYWGSFVEERRNKNRV